MKESILVQVRQNKRLIILLSLTCLNGLLWIGFIPFDGAPDEVHKYEVVYYISQNGYLPTFGPNADIYIRQAPGTRDGFVYGVAALYPVGSYVLTSGLMSLFVVEDPTDLLYVARLFSLICLLITLSCIYRIVQLLFAQSDYALVATAFAAFIPQVTYIGAYVNDDAYQMMAVSLTILSCIKLWQQGWQLKYVLGVSIALVAVSLGKQNGWVAAFPFVVITLFSISFAQKLKVIGLWLLVCVPPVITLGAWLTRNLILYGDPMAQAVGVAGWQDFTTRLGIEWVPLVDQGVTLTNFFSRTGWLQMMFESFWGRFFYMSVTLPANIYSNIMIFSAIGISATIGLLLFKRANIYGSSTSIIRFSLATIIAFILLCAAAIWTSLYNDFQAQGRYFFPLLGSIVIALTAGVFVLSKQYLVQYAASFWLLIIVMFMTLNGYSLVTRIYQHPYPIIPIPAF